MRIPLAVATCLVLLVGACGGKTTSGGPGSGSGGGGGRGSSSGGGSGSSSGGSYCAPLPGCTSSTQCPAPDGCNDCSCSDGQWACTELGCDDEGGIFTDAAVGDCPPVSQPGESCSADGTSCSYDAGQGCEETCFCEGLWACSTSGCSDGGDLDGGAATDASVGHGLCPSVEPPGGSSCSDVSTLCSYGECPTNCLCTIMGWICAKAPGCP